MPQASTKQEERMEQQRRELGKGLGAGGQILKGSLIERFTVCSRPGCRCLKGKKHGPYLYVSVFDGKQSRQVYVPQEFHEQVRQWVHNARELAETVDKLSDLSVALIRLRQPKGGGRAVNAQKTPSKGR